jgi:hypothetical protein
MSRKVPLIKKLNPYPEKHNNIITRDRVLKFCHDIGLEEIELDFLKTESECLDVEKFLVRNTIFKIILSIQVILIQDKC